MTKEYSVPPAEDSSPTPVIELGYKDICARLLILASRLDANSLIFSKNLSKINIKDSKRCKELANELRRLAEMVSEWPKKPGFAISGQKNYIAERYIDIMKEATHIVGERINIRNIGEW